MTAHPIDTEALREKSETLGFYGDRPELCDEAVYGLWAALAAAEHRATRAEAQSAIRGRAVVMYRDRAREAEAERDEWRQTALDERAAALDALEQIKAREARIKSVQDALDEIDSDQHAEWAYDGVRGTAAEIRRALDGDA